MAESNLCLSLNWTQSNFTIDNVLDTIILADKTATIGSSRLPQWTAKEAQLVITFTIRCTVRNEHSFYFNKVHETYQSCWHNVVTPPRFLSTTHTGDEEEERETDQLLRDPDDQGFFDVSSFFFRPIFFYIHIQSLMRSESIKKGWG